MKITIILLSSLSLVFFLSACSRKAGDPPRDRIETVLAIFDSLDRDDHVNALAKIRHLRSDDVTNPFLPEFESVENENLIIAKASEEIRKGNVQAAGRLLLRKEHLRKDGSVMKAQETIRTIMLLETLAEKIKTARTAKDLDRSTEQFIKNACLLQERGASLVRFAEEARKKIPLMEKREKELSLFDIAADEAILLNSGDFAAPSVKAMLEVERKKIKSEK